MLSDSHFSENLFPHNDTGATLRQHFPHCFDKNGDFDFNKFQKELSSSDINFSKESYGMDWLGKSYARLLATDPAKTLIREDRAWNSKEDNKNSENLLIQGDNLEVLKHLSNAYHEKIKMIYIDPPYNTGSDGFVYTDNRTFTVAEFSELAGVDTDQAKKILSFVNSKSNSHSAWLTFMYPRLYIARQLLQDDGIIFVSIDDNEVAQLRILMNEIFGEENCISNYIWESTFRPDNSSKLYRKNAENILCYAKNIKSIDRLIGSKDGSDGLPSLTKNSMNEIILNFESNTVETFLENGRYLKGVRSSGYELLNDVEIKNGLIITDFSLKGRMIWGQDYLNEEITKGTKIIIKTDGFVPYSKKLETSILAPNTIIPNEKVADVLGGRAEVSGLFQKTIFDYPKPTSLIKYFLSYFENNNYLVLDFFAGSGTTGDAVMQLNSEDRASGKEANRRYILVQLPELIDEKKNKTAFDFVHDDLGIAEPTIFEITKERLIRAGSKIGDTSGFRVFQTQPIWEDYEFTAREFDPQATLFDESQLTSDDIETLLTTWKTYDNIALTESLSSVDLGGYMGYYGKGRLYLMDSGFDTRHLSNLLEKIDEDTTFNPVSIIVFGYHFESKILREIAENVASYANKKKLDIDFITRY